MSPPSSTTFGDLLKQLRKRAGLTQGELAAAVGYSVPFISNLELNQRLPDVQAVIQTFVPALGLHDDPQTAAALIKQAALARGERPPASLTLPRTTQLLVQAERVADAVRLPSPPTELIGRAAEVTQLCNRLLGHRGRLLTLVGPPGIGKTTLALAVADRLQPHYADGVVFVPLAAATDASVMNSMILATLGQRESTARSPKAQLVEFLRRKAILLVLDNLEQMSDAAPFIADLLVECPGLVVLATSRERLHLRAEQRYKVPPLALAPAVELFVQRAQAVEGAFQSTAQHRPLVEAICQRLDCLPLAIELCAPQVELFTLEQLLVELQAHALDLLVDGAHDLPPQHRTLRRAIERSYRLLDAEEQTLLRTLGIFVGGFALAQAEAVYVANQETQTRPVQALLHALIHKSLVRSEPTPAGEPRFLLLETIREFALEQAHAQGEEALLRQRHYAAYLHLARIGDSHVRTPEVANWLARLKPERDNFRAALQWGIQEKRYTDAAWLLLALGYYWFLIGQRYATAAALKQLLPHRHTFPPDLRLAILIVSSAAVPPEEGVMPVADYVGEILQLLDVCSNRLLQATAWARIAYHTTDVPPAVAFERAIVLARSATPSTESDPAFGAATDRNFLLGTNLLHYATFQLDRGEVPQSTALATESLLINRAQGDNSMLLNCLALLGRAALLQGELTQAQGYFQEVMTIAATFHYATPRCEWQPVLGLVCCYQGNLPEARRLLQESIHFCREQQEKFFLARTYTYLAEVALATGALGEAEQSLAQSVAAYADPRQITLDEVERLLIAARLATAQRHYLWAATLFGLAEQSHSRSQAVLARPMRSLAEAARATVQAALKPASFAEALAAGQQLSLEAAYATFLAYRHKS